MPLATNWSNSDTIRAWVSSLPHMAQWMAPYSRGGVRKLPAASRTEGTVICCHGRCAARARGSRTGTRMRNLVVIRPSIRAERSGGDGNGHAALQHHVAAEERGRLDLRQQRCGSRDYRQGNQLGPHCTFLLVMGSPSLTSTVRPERSTLRAFSMTNPFCAVILQFSNFTFSIGLSTRPCIMPTEFTVPVMLRMVTLRTTGSTFAGGAMGGTIRHSMLNSNACFVSFNCISRYVMFSTTPLRLGCVLKRMGAQLPASDTQFLTSDRTE